MTTTILPPPTTTASWLFDALAVTEALEGKERLDLWQDVVAALRLLDAAERARGGPEEADLLVAAMERVSTARCALPDELGTPSLLLATARTPASEDVARAGLADDAAWLRASLLTPGEPPAAQVASILRSLAHHVLALLGR